MKSLFTPLWLGALIAAGSTTAHAVEYKAVAAEKSQITFHYKQMGVAMEGQFKKFSAQLNFDPAKPAAAHAQIDIDLASVDTAQWRPMTKWWASLGST